MGAYWWRRTDRICRIQRQRLSALGPRIAESGFTGPTDRNDMLIEQAVPVASSGGDRPLRRSVAPVRCGRNAHGTGPDPLRRERASRPQGGGREANIVRPMPSRSAVPSGPDTLPPASSSAATRLCWSQRRRCSSVRIPRSAGATGPDVGWRTTGPGRSHDRSVQPDAPDLCQQAWPRLRRRRIQSRRRVGCRATSTTLPRTSRR